MKSKRPHDSHIINASHVTKACIVEETSSTEYKPVLINVSELSVVHKVCSEIVAAIEKVPNYTQLNNLNIEEYVSDSLIFLLDLLTSSCDENYPVILSICQDIIFRPF